MAKEHPVDRKTASLPASRSSLMGLVQSCALLGIGMPPASIALACLVAGGASQAALACAALAGAVCWCAAALALAATYVGNSIGAPVQGMLAGMLFRMGIPLAAILASPGLGAPQGATGTILGVYLITLVAETALALRMVWPESGQQLLTSRDSVAG